MWDNFQQDIRGYLKLFKSKKLFTIIVNIIYQYILKNCSFIVLQHFFPITKITALLEKIRKYLKVKKVANNLTIQK